MRPLFIYADYLPDATATATDSAAGYTPAHVLGGTQDLAWKPANTAGEKHLDIDLSEPLLRGAVAIVGEYLAGVVLEVRAGDNGVDFPVVLSAAAPVDGASFTTAWRSWAAVSHRYIRLAFSGFTSSFEVQHVAVSPAELLPYPEDGHDPDAFQPDAKHLISESGYYLGTVQRKTMRALSLSFGQVTVAQYAVFQRWAEACAKRQHPFFYVPDSALPPCYFGWVDEKYKFSAPQKAGMHKVAPILFNGRLP